MNYSTTVTGGLRRILFYLLLTFLTWSAYGQTGCDCPEGCSPCTGGLVSLTIRYNGALSGLGISAKDGAGNNLAGSLVGNTITFKSLGYSTTPFAGGKVIVTALILLVPVSTVTINTTCADPIYQGITYEDGDFTILGGESVGGVKLCCSSSGEPSNPPIITTACPTNIVTSATTGLCGANVSWTPPQAINNNCSNSDPATATSDYDPGDFFNVGTTTVTYTFTDVYGNTANCSFNVTVNDTQLPQITCPGNKTATADVNCEFVLPDYTSEAVVTDNCGVGGVTKTQSPAAGSTVSGILPHTITITAKDASNNTSQCTFTVTLTDNIAPQITTCVPNKTATADANCEFVLPDYTADAVATDNCGVGGITKTQSPAPGSTVSGLLPHTITITAKDASNNTSQCTFTVTLTDNTAPQITTCVPNKTATADSNCEFVLPDYTAEAITTDNCGVGGVTKTQSPAAGSTVSGLLPHTITITAKDASNNTSQCTFTVTLTDNIAPQITTCVPNKTATADSNCQFVLPDYTAEAITTDNCGVGGVTKTQSPAAGSTVSGLTPHTITITAKDASNNTSQCTFTVTLTDNTAPQITTCVPNKAVTADANCSFVLPDYTSETFVTDNCGVGGVTKTQSPAAGSTLSGLLPHTITITAKDASNNTSQCTFTVTLTDNTAPQITTCVPNKTATANATNCSFVLPDYTSEAVVTDNCGVGGVIKTQSPAPGSTVTGLTPHTITITAKDASNNSTQCTFTVTLTDNTAPLITCPANKTVAANAACSFTLPNYTTEAITSDNCGGSVTVTQSPDMGTVVTGIMAHTITLTAKDAANNTSQCTFTVTLTDNIAPQITCPANKTAQASANCTFTLPDYTSEAVTSDNCGGTITVTQDPAPNSILSGLGAHTITFTAKDASNNTSQCSFFSITLTDNIKPQITCPANKTAVADANCSFTIPDYTAEATATDNCGGSVTVTQSPAMGTVVNGLVHTITLTATDASNNTKQCTFTLTLTDNIAPQITCPADKTATMDASCSFTVPNYTTEAITTDKCGGTITVTQSPAAGTVINTLGAQTITLTAKDVSNNTKQCTFTLTLTDNTSPQITTCVPNKTATADANCSFVLPDYTSDAVATDNCGAGGVTKTQSPAPGSTVSGLLPHTITITAKDASNNTSQCTFTVTLTDNTAPQITTCVPNKTATADATCSFVLPDYTSEAIATDNCGIGGVTKTQSPAAGSTVSGILPHTITITAKDASDNTSQCTFTVTLIDNTAPQITTCVPNKTATANSSCEFVLPDYTSEAIATDNCGVGGVTKTQSPAAGSTVSGLLAHTITVTAKDASNNTSQCTFTVTLTDNTAPQITTCVPNKTATADANCEFLLPDYTSEAIATDNCGVGGVTKTQSPAAGSTVSGLLPHTITITAKDASNNTSQCTFTVTLTDNTAPQITTCVPNKTAAANANCEFVLPDYTSEAVATDNCGVGGVTKTQNPAAGSTVSGLLPHTITITAKDASNNTTQCTFTVTLTDNTAPQITTCVPNKTAAANANCEFVLPDYTSEAIATDNCGVGGVTKTQSPAAGSTVSGLLAHTITIIAKDASNNTSQCTFTVTLTDNTTPQITTCVPNKTATADSNCEFVLPDYTSDAVATDNCGAGGVTKTQSPAAGSTVSGLLPHTITITAKDASNNTSQCTFTLTLTDNTAPQITTCVPNKTATADANCDFVLPDYTSDAVATDNCGVGGVTKTQSPAAGSTVSGLLAHTITITARDASNNTSQCTFTVTLTDNTAPQITTCVPNKTATADSNCEFVLPDYTAEAVATDNCGAGGITKTQSPAAGATVSGLLSHTITITAKDASNNTSQCTFTVTLTDNTAPQITTCVPNKTATADSNCEFVLPDYASEAIATDNCGVGAVTITQSPAAGSTVSGLLPHTITITAKDASNNSSQCTFTVTLTDNIAPQISGCPADITVSSESSSCGATVTWTEPTASDNCSLSTFVGTPSSGSVFAVGTTPVTYTATDSKGNTSTCSFNVTVKDETLPVITNCPSDITVSFESTSCGATVTWTEPTATDNCSISTFVSTHASGSAFEPGITTVTYTATDVHGNISTCTFKVTVNDETSPQISGCPSDITVSAEANSCGATVSWTQPTASDNCSVSSFVSSHSSGSVFSAGTTVVTYTATDASGNTTQCSFNVIVTDNMPPVITCLSDIQVSANALCKASVQWSEPAISDCSNVTTTRSHDPGDIFEFGTTEVTYIATDSKGNSTTCKFNVIVKDNTAPAFANCPTEIKTTATTSCNAVVNWTAPSASDDCGIASVTSTHNSGDTFPMGTTVVKYTATDINGNTSVCQFNVIVANEHAVQFTSCPANIIVKAGESGQLAVEWTEPEAIAECSEVTITKTHASGDIFSLGQTEVIYQATDLAGNTAECKFVIDVSYEDIKFDITRIVTPDGDGINDVWKLANIEKFNNNVVTVVDRWGSVIYNASGYNNENIVWRGENQSGVLVPTGTYFYTIRVDFAGSHVEKRGFIELVR